MRVVKKAKELAKAIRENESTIEIQGSLAKRTIIIKATGKLAWLLCLFCIFAAIVLYFTAPALTVGGVTVTLPAGGAGGLAGLVGLGGAITFTVGATTVLGLGAFWTVICLAIASGGLGGLFSLRSRYKIVEKGKTRVVLKRKE